MSVDREFNVQITGDASSAIAASKGAATAMGGAADEASRYEAALRQMAIASKAAEEAQRRAGDESERYQATLEQMANRGADGGSKALNPFGDGWLAGVAERKAALQAEGAAAKAAFDEMGKGAEAAAGKKKELVMVMNALGKAFPGLKSMAHALFNPLTLGAILFAKALTAIKGNIEDLSAAIEETPWEGFSNRAKKAIEPIAEMRDLAKEAEEASARLMDVFNARQSAEEKLDAAQKRRELAQARGIEDPALRARAEADIEERYAKREMDRDKRGRDMKLAEQERRAAELRNTEAALGNQIGVGKAMQEKMGTPEDLKQRLDDMRGKLKAEKEALDKQQKTYDEKFTGFAGFMNDGFLNEGQKKRLEEDMEQRRNRIDALNRGISRDESRLPYSQRLGSWLEMAQDRFKGVRQSREGIEAMLPTQRTVAGIANQADAQAFGVDRGTRGIEAMNTLGKAHQDLSEEAAKWIATTGNLPQVIRERLDAVDREMALIRKQTQDARTRMAAGRNS